MAPNAMKICRKCREPQTDPRLAQCPTCHAPFVEEDEPTRLPDEDIERIAARLAGLLKQDGLESVAEKVRRLFKDDDWKLLAEQVMKMLHPHEFEVIAKALMGMWRFWITLILVIGAALFLIYEA